MMCRFSIRGVQQSQKNVLSISHSFTWIYGKMHKSAGRTLGKKPSPLGEGGRGPARGRMRGKLIGSARERGCCGERPNIARKRAAMAGSPLISPLCGQLLPQGRSLLMRHSAQTFSSAFSSPVLARHFSSQFNCRSRGFAWGSASISSSRRAALSPAVR